MENFKHSVRPNQALRRFYSYVMTMIFVASMSIQSNAQCVAPPGTVKGLVYTDINNNGVKSTTENGLSGVQVQAYGPNGQIVGTATSNSTGEFSISGLTDGVKIKLVFGYQSKYAPSFMGSSNESNVQIVTVPSCSASLGLISYSDVCNTETMIVTPCFVQGPVTGNTSEPSIVGIKYGFTSVSPMTKIASHGETGSVWGITNKNSTGEIFSAAFVKQLVGLKDGHDAIFRTIKSGSTYTTSTFVKLSNLGQAVGTLGVTNVSDCAYGNQVGKLGLGALIISPDEKYLYTVNLFNNKLVRITTSSPTAANTVAYNIPDPGCDNAESRAFALKYHNGKIYVGVTCTAETAQDDTKSSANIYEFNPVTGVFSLIFSTPYLKGYWYDAPTDGLDNMQWLTDIDFTDDGNMVLGISDRLGHKYCNNVANRLDEQKSDILMVWNDNGTWKLEDNGSAGALIGSGASNGQGPNGGEFFGSDFFPGNPTYHPDVALGGLFIMPGTNSVAAVVFDPEDDTYSGGLHRYDTRNGSLLGSRELYTRNTNVNLGKATGFGDLVALCGLPDMEIGNYVWNDSNENGIQDAGENPIAGLILTLLDENCAPLSTATTSPTGYYVFNNTNVTAKIEPNKQYYLALSSTQKDALTGDILLNDNYYKITTSSVSGDAVNNDASTSTLACPSATMSIRTGNTSHNFDLGLKPAGPCSVKLTSTINTTAPRVSDPIIMNYKLENLGGTLVKGIKLNTDLPTGMTFAATENIGWENNSGVLTYTDNTTMAPTRMTTARLTLRFNPAAPVYSFDVVTTINDIKNAKGDWTDDVEGCLVDESYGITSGSPTICDLSLILNTKKDQIIAKNANVAFTTTVCNQGNQIANNFTIINYRNGEFDFDPNLNPGWVISQDLSTIKLTVTDPLLIGECKNFDIVYTMSDEVGQEDIVNYAEISAQQCQGVAVNFDFDSTPDGRKTNDNGGHPNTATDNETDNHGDIDEDDHDPALISLNQIDFALRKTIQTRRVLPGQLITFNLAITNQGDVAASRIKLVDYIPTYLTLADAEWTKVGNNAERQFTIAGNLQPGATYNATITFRVDANTPVPFKIQNFAEIAEVIDAANRNISNSDIDSNPDNIKDLSAEDDIANADVVLMGVESNLACNSCRQGTTPSNGQFEAVIRIASQSGETWTVQSSLGMYTLASTIASPVVMPDGTVLTEGPHPTPGHSYYTLSGVHLQGEGYDVNFINNNGEIETVSASGSTCRFSTVQISGIQSTCSAATLEYNVSYAASLDLDEEDISWILDGTTDVGEGDNISIDWSAYPLGLHTITVIVDGESCVAPAQYQVTTGIMSTESISCISELNISMDGNCEIVVLPAMLLAGTPNPGSPYVVMLIDEKGNTIPNATLTKEHIGKTITAKLLDGCGGNSCWAKILVEDKLGPVSICRDIQLPCNQLDEYTGPFERDNCGGPISTKLINETITVLNCDDDFVKLIDRSYQATDASGNKSAVCNMTISLLRPDMALLKFPHSLMMSNDSAIICSDKIPLDENKHPHPSYTGVPKLAGQPIYPTSDPICNIYTGYTDEVFQVGCATKIIRSWLVVEEHCSISNMYRFNQILEIIDIVAPVITALPDQTVTTNSSLECEGNVVLALPTVIDSCGGAVEIDVVYENGFINNMVNPKTITLPAGEHTIQYVAYDQCENSSSISIIVKVEDKTQPTVLCKGTTAIGLNTNGEAILYPYHLDNGSYDGCGLGDKFIALVGTTSNIPDSLFKKSLTFDCDDAGKTLMVALRVYDTQRNSNSCMVAVEVQDKTMPSISCPANVVVNCDEVDNDSDLTIYGTAQAFDACKVTITEDTPAYDLSACRVGSILRTFIASDGTNEVECYQTITVQNNNVWDPETGLVESVDFEIEGLCDMRDLDPENLTDGRGFPEITQGVCSMVSATHDDDVYNIVQGACMKILRKWTVIDWCEMQKLGDDYEPYTFNQVIKVLNTVAPTFKTIFPAIDTIFAAPGNCDDAVFIGSAIAKDDCPVNIDLQWSYTIDYGNNGSIDDEDSGVDTIIYINTLLPLGENKITWSFEDRCGNVTSKSQLIRAINDDLPIVDALNSISIAIQPWDTNGDGIADIEKGCIYAKDLNVSSVSPCCEEPLIYSFSSNPLDTVRCFSCFDLGNVNTVKLYAHNCFGRYDFVNVNVNVQDNNNSNICELICQLNTPIIVIPTVTPRCPGTNVTLTANVTYPIGATATNSTFIWSNNATTQSITVNPAVATSYTVTVSNQSGCNATASRQVTVLPIPTIAIASNNICQGGSATLTASGANTYVWSTGTTGAVLTVSPPATQTYTVTGTDINGCTNTAQRTVIVSLLPSVSINPALAPTICPGTPTTLTAIFNTANTTGTFLWSANANNATTASVTVAPATTMTYTVTATVNGCTNTANKVVTVIPNPIANITGDSTICLNENTTLTATGGGTYLWNTGVTTASINVTGISTNTAFRVTVTNATGCIAVVQRTVTVWPLPTVSITPITAAVCIGGTATLTAAGGGTYVWSTGATTASITTPALNVSTPFTVTVTNTAGCVASAVRNVTVNPLPNVNAGPDRIIECVPPTLVLNGTSTTSGATYVWAASNGGNIVSGANTLTPTVSSAGTYTLTVTVTATGCSASDATVVTAATSLPVANAGADVTVCSGVSTTLTATGGGAYAWSTNPVQNTASIIVTPTQTTTFTVTVTAANGCSATDQVVVTVNPLPVANAGLDQVLTCTATTAVLNGSSSIPTSTFAWVATNGGTITSGGMTATPTVSTTGTYTLTVTAAGCSATDVVLVTSNTTPPTVNAGADIVICIGTSTTLIATGSGTSYSWNTTPAQTTASITVSPMITTTYVVTSTSSSNGCTASDQVVVTITPLPTAAITGDNMICLGESTILTATGGGTYLWSTGATTSAITVSPITMTTYIVTVTNNGCTATASTTVSVDPGVLTCSTMNITRYLDATGSITITPQDISTGTMGACANFTASVFPNMFACNDTQTNNGVQTVTLTVTNTNNGQSTSCTAQVTVRDTIKPTIVCPANQAIICSVFNPNTNFGNATTSDNCPFGLTILGPVVVNTLNLCNVGSITRTFTARDLSLNTRVCTQTISVTNPNPVTLASITFPPDITVTNCQGVASAVTGIPVLTPINPPCSDLSITFTDDAPIAVPLCIDTIMRTWRVVDSCQLVAGTQNGIFTKVQRIIVTVPAPVINGPATITLYATPSSGCQGILNTANPAHTATGCNLILSNTRNALPSFNINGTYPVGTTNVTLTARETCLNQITNRQVQIIVLDTTFTDLMCRKTFPKILDTNPPIARDTARSHAIINVSCANPGAVRISYSRTVIGDSIRLYTCADRLVDFTIEIFMYVNGVVVDSCTTIATPQDPDDHCIPGLVGISGNIKTENGQNVPNVLVDLQGANITNPLTDMNGKYVFPMMDLGGEYTMKPLHDKNHIDGVSTLDLILIQRHILKLKNLDSPYKLIAGDINKDGKLTATDIVELRKLILGIYDKFPTNTSWRMIDDKYTFTDPTNSLSEPFNEKYYIPSLTENMLINWIGVKVGDVNGSYVTNAQDKNVSSRTTGFGFLIEDKPVGDGLNTMVVKANSAAPLSGFQLSFKLENASDITIKAGGIALTKDHYHVSPDGKVTISWADKNVIALSKGQTLFEITYYSEAGKFTSEMMNMTNHISAEYYDISLTARPLAVSYFIDGTPSFELMGNAPNPWQSSTDIKFALPQAGDVTFTIRDITGRTVLQKTSSFAKGLNTYNVQADEIGSYGGGILMVEMTYQNQMKSMKMLQIK